jgi:hypothetical protein
LIRNALSQVSIGFGAGSAVIAVSFIGMRSGVEPLIKQQLKTRPSMCTAWTSLRGLQGAANAARINF